MSGKAFYGIMLWRSRLNTSEASIRYKIQMSSINLQTPIIYPSVVFFSIRIVTITPLYCLKIRGDATGLGYTQGYDEMFM